MITNPAKPRTLFAKIWGRHRIMERDDGQTLLYVDREFIGDDLPPTVFGTLAAKGLRVRSPERVFGTPDHYVPTIGNGTAAIEDPERREMVQSLMRNGTAADVTLFPQGDPRQGILHVIGPEQGLSLPGMIIVCGDSHTTTHGALGAFAFGIGASELSHVLATQTLWQTTPRTLRVVIDGELGNGVTAKDIILAIIGKIGAAGATGFVIEYAGSAVRALSVEARMTLCNMSIEAGSRAGMIAPDEATLAYLEHRPYAPKGEEWLRARSLWRELATDPEAVFDREIAFDAEAIEPMVTWGTSPDDSGPISGRVPDPDNVEDTGRRARLKNALDYMALTPGTPFTDITVDCVFIGSCTNGRIEDLRAVARVADGRKACVPTFVVPGSGLVKRQAEVEGLDRIFRAAGFEWRAPGCSMCLAVNGDVISPGQRCASTSNRNFIGRQGPGARTHLMSPAMAAAAAVTGRLTDVRHLG